MTQETKVTQADYGTCVGCGESIEFGQVLTVWDDEVGHADCDNPFDLNHSHPRDADWPAPVVLLGSPALYVPLQNLAHPLGAKKLGRWLDALEEAVSLKDYPAHHMLIASNRSDLARHRLASTEAADALLREARAWVFIAEHDEHCELHPDYGAQNLEASNDEAEQNALEAGGDERDVSYRTHPEDAVCTCERGDLLNRIDTHLKGANHEQG